MSTTTLVSLEELERLEADEPEKFELFRGELIRLPVAKKHHTLTCHRIYKPLNAAFEARQAANPEVPLGEVYMEMGYLLPTVPRTRLVPDDSITHPNQPSASYYEGAPLVAFEVVSDSERAQRLAHKVAEYLAHGSKEVWAIYPWERHALVYRQGTVRIETQTIRSEFFPGIELSLNDVLPPIPSV